MDGLRCEPLPDGLRRYAAYDGVGLHVPRHHRPGGHDGAVTDPHAGEDDGLIADPDIAADDNVPPVVPGLRDLRDGRVPRLVEDGKGIGGQGLQRVVGAGEQEFRAAGDGAEFSDHQPVAVDGVVIEHIVAREFRGVPEEIVVDRVIPHRNIGV